eukprot:6194171-Pleurochrysis_carterae.AAC.1
MQRTLKQASAAARAANKGNATAISKFEAELQRTKEERIRAQVHKEQTSSRGRRRQDAVCRSSLRQHSSSSKLAAQSS